LFVFKGEWSLVDEDGIEGGGGELGDGVWPGLESENGLDEILGRFGMGSSIDNNASIFDNPLNGKRK